jgi:hypothetical protein
LFSSFIVACYLLYIFHQTNKHLANVVHIVGLSISLFLKYGKRWKKRGSVLLSCSIFDRKAIVVLEYVKVAESINRFSFSVHFFANRSKPNEFMPPSKETQHFFRVPYLTAGGLEAALIPAPAVFVVSAQVACSLIW